MRIVTDLARDDAILGTLFTTVSDNLSPHYAKANVPVPDAPKTFKALRDFPYHIEAFLASSFAPAKPSSYGLTENKPFVMINFDTRQVGFTQFLYRYAYWSKAESFYWHFYHEESSYSSSRLS